MHIFNRAAFVDDALTTKVSTMTRNVRFSRKIFKKFNILLIGSLFSVLFLIYMTFYAKVVTETLQRRAKTENITSKPVNINNGNTSTKLKYYPDHKAHDYPLPILPDPYMINNERACRNMSQLKYIVIVISASQNFNRRKGIRRTWGRLSYYKKGEVKVVFILGRPELDMTQKLIEEENRAYHDMVQGKFLDSYRNLTHKSVLAIRWVKEHCLNSKMVIKVDDDMVVNLFQLFNMITKGECCQNPLEITCYLRQFGDSNIYRSGSEKKWIIEPDYFPNMKVYPFAYCDGVFLMIPPAAIPILYETATRMPYFWIEDVYITGILVSQSNKIRLANMEGIWSFDWESKDCIFTNTEECLFIAGPAGNIKDALHIWSFVLKYYHDSLDNTKLK